jgi:transcriptional regulator of acetoin/glycerol metabolism
MAWEMLFDAAGRRSPMEVPLWSGLTLQVLALPRGSPDGQLAVGAKQLPLKDLETAMIRSAVDEARGNVMRAAQALGISRATVYRRLGKK